MPLQPTTSNMTDVDFVLIPSLADPSEMVTIPCAFEGCIHRVDICEGTATSFFKTAKGTIWPLCRACTDQHKKMAAKLVANDQIEVLTAVGASFDIPLDDADTLAAFRAQDPQRIQRVLDAADAAFLRRTR